jgi:hypothetical protein
MIVEVFYQAVVVNNNFLGIMQRYIVSEFSQKEVKYRPKTSELRGLSTLIVL